MGDNEATSVRKDIINSEPCVLGAAGRLKACLCVQHIGSAGHVNRPSHQLQTLRAQSQTLLLGCV
jgi:hypothetical protein